MRRCSRSLCRGPGRPLALTAPPRDRRRIQTRCVQPADAFGDVTGSPLTSNPSRPVSAWTAHDDGSLSRDDGDAEVTLSPDPSGRWTLEVWDGDRRVGTKRFGHDLGHAKRQALSALRSVAALHASDETG